MSVFADRLAEAVSRAGSPVCVGLDPVYEKLPAELRSGADHCDAIEAFSAGVIDACRSVVPAVKFQSACFERYGSRGVRALELCVKRAVDAGLAVVLDAKRGDIGISAEHYAAAAAGIGAHAITVSGYLGMSTVEPYLKAGLGVFVLVRTSNPDSDTVQSECLTGGETVAEMMARRVAALGKGWMGASGMSSVGAVVGATKAADAKALRAIMPEQFFLVPGYGAQGGTADDVRAMLTPARGGVLVTASRSVIYPTSELGVAWQAAVSRAAKGFASEVAAVIRV